MALKKEDIQATYPLPAYNYLVHILDDDAPTLNFSEVSGLTQEYEPVTYKHGLSYAMGDVILPGMRQALNITLKRGVFKADNYLSDWFDQAQKTPFSDTALRDIVISLSNPIAEQDITPEPLVSWHISGAMPIKLEAPNFQADSNDVAIESMTLIAQKLSVNYG